MEQSLSSEFISQSILRMSESLERVKICLDLLDEEDVWKRPNSSSNSIGNLILHLCGNIRQYAVSSLSGAPDTRIRDEEFAAKGGYTKAELWTKIKATVEEAFQSMGMASVDELLRVRMVQGFELSGMGIIIHVTEHFSYHTGQIAFWTKSLQDRDLGFYAGMDLNMTNE
ncbi:MAG: DUF1572 family protein [Lewinellaceae bacterium]|nr:DUF1572 family protein [Saprospiraceae bacterium]MCB9343322.1 DUF1572 family protein [Lewinellaceae bacterium]